MSLFKPKSFAWKMTLPVLLISCISLLLLSYFHLYSLYSSHKEQAFKDLDYELSNETASIKAEIQELINDIVFLSKVPPIKGIMRSELNKGTDPTDLSTSLQWKARLNQIFSAMLSTKNKYLQIRYVGLADKGKELVRVEKNIENGLIVTDPSLQSKKNEFYFSEILKMNPGKVYLSPITLNREHGKISLPKTLVLRGAIPVYNKASDLFGFIIINLNANKLFSKITKLEGQKRVLDILDEESKKIVRVKSNPKQVLEYKEIDFSSEQKESSSFLVKLQGKEYLFSEKKIYYDPMYTDRHFSVSLGVPVSEIISKIMPEIYFQSFIILILLIVSLFLKLYFFRLQFKPLKEIKSISEDLVKGKEIIKPKYLKNHDDELGAVLQAFYLMADKIKEKTEKLIRQKEALDLAAYVAKFDSKGIITYLNHNFLNKSLFKNENLVGLSYRSFLEKDNPKKLLDEIASSINKGVVWRGEIKKKDKNGSSYWVDSTIIPFLNRDGVITNYIDISFDITSTKEDEKKAEKLAKEKSLFFSKMSHELRSPLSSIMGINEVLSSTKLNETQREYVEIIKDSSQNLFQILNNILDLSKFKSGKMTLNNDPISISHLLDRTFSMFKLKAEQKNISLTKTISDEVPPVILIDGLRFQQILINLISNSLKFTEKGSVAISLFCDKSTGDFHDLRLVVKDTGKGIKKEFLNTIFVEYEQANSASGNLHGGTGLGLSICKKIVEAMDGKIKVESQEGKGSIFTVTLKAKSGSFTQDEKSQNIESLKETMKHKSLSLLMADDSVVNQKVFKSMISILGLETHIASDGEKAFEAVKKETYDLIYLDINMPLLNGLDLAKKIINHYKDKPLEKPWLIALTANVFSEDKAMCFKAGFDDFLGKPYSKKDLQKSIINFLNSKDQTPPDPGADLKLSHKAPSSSPRKNKSLKILDQEQIAELLLLDKKDRDEIYRVFLSASKKALLDLKKSIENDDYEKQKETAHLCKGMFANMGFKACYEICLEIESESSKPCKEKSLLSLERLLRRFSKSKEEYQLQLKSL